MVLVVQTFNPNRACLRSYF